ncbi:hypothetical protein Tco_0503240 [Tanacetum coccineum]
MAEYSQKWHNGTSSRTRSTKTSDGLGAIQAQLNNLRREIKKGNEKVYAAQVGWSGFHQQNNGNSSYSDLRPSLEESLTKFMAELATRHEENSNIIKEIQAFTDAAIRNQGALIKTLEIQIGQMGKVFQERGFGSLPSSTETNLGDQVKSILTANADFCKTCGIRPGPYAAQDVKILDAYDHTLPQKEKDSGSFTLPCFIHNIYFDKALVDLGANFIILDIPEDDDVPLILGRPFLSTAHSKIDVFKRKISLRVGEEKLVFKSIKPASSIIKRVFVIKSLDSKTELIKGDDEPFDPTYGFTIIDGDDMTKDVVLGMKFCKKYASWKMIMKKFALEDKRERIMKDE